MRFIEGVEWFNFEIVSKTPNIVSFYVSMAFIVGMTSKHAKRSIYPFIHFLYKTINILTRNAKDPNVYGWEMIKQE